MKRLLCFFLILMIPSVALGAWNQTHIEDFSALSTITAGNPPAGFTLRTDAGFNTSLRTRVIGPRKNTSAAPGASMLMPQSLIQMTVNVSGNWVIHGWFMVDERTRTDDAAHTVTPAILLSGVDTSAEGGSGPQLHVDSSGNWTATVYDFVGFGGNTTTSTPMAFGFNQWVFVECVWNGSNECRWYYKLPGGSLTLWFDQAGMNASNTYGKSVGSFTLLNALQPNLSQGNEFRWGGRVGLLGTATIGTFADVAYQSTWVDPPTTPNVWYVRRTATGAGNGTTWANAWSPAQLADELANWGVMPTSTSWKYQASGAAVPATIDVRDLDYGIQNKTIVHAGDTIYIDGEQQLVRINSGQLLVQPGEEGLEVAPYNGARLTLNFSTVLPNWTNVSGKVWKAANTATLINLWENGVWLNFIQGTSFSAISSALTSATQNSFGCDGSYIYLALPDGTNPNSNGRVYELGTGGGINITGASTYMHGLTIANTAAFVNSNFAPSAQYGVLFPLAGLSVLDGINTINFDKHGIGTAAAAGYANGSRVVVRNCTASGGAPYAYLGYGGQTAFVMYIDAAGSASLNNQIIWDTCNSLLNGSSVGSATPFLDSTQPGFLTHNGGTATPLPLALVVLRNCSFASFSQSNIPNTTTPETIAAQPYQLINTVLNTTPAEGVVNVADTLVPTVKAIVVPGIHGWLGY